MREPITLSWDEWRASRAAKSEYLRQLGLAAPSRRVTDYGTGGTRLRRAFGGERVPQWTVDNGKDDNASGVAQA